MYDLIVIGAGAAGCFAAIRAAEFRPGLSVLILEKSARTLDKVRISGGGRCNVTHDLSDARLLSTHYPRGQRELMGPFTRWNPADMRAWLLGHGVAIKAEADGRMFPVTDRSETVTELFMALIARYGIGLCTGTAVEALRAVPGGVQVHTAREVITGRFVLVATGSSDSGWQLLREVGHSLVPPVPSLFAFDSSAAVLAGLQGISVPRAGISIGSMKARAEGPLLITHRGISGPAVLRLSAFRAREMAVAGYQFTAMVDWLPDISEGEMQAELMALRTPAPMTMLANARLWGLPARLAERIVTVAGMGEMRCGQLTVKSVGRLCDMLKRCPVEVTGKSTHKEEFVTAGGVDLREVDLRTMQSRVVPGLLLAGEVLNIDAVTGGFNFQAAWTAGEQVARTLRDC